MGNVRCSHNPRKCLAPGAIAVLFYAHGAGAAEPEAIRLEIATPAGCIDEADVRQEIAALGATFRDANLDDHARTFRVEATRTEHGVKGQLIVRDLVFRERRLRAGDPVLPFLSAANRDPRQFRDPDRLDLAREPNRHLAFGWGIHFCLGAPLARLELEVLFATLLREIPSLELAETRPEFRGGLVFRGLESLRVRW